MSRLLFFSTLLLTTYVTGFPVQAQETSAACDPTCAFALSAPVTVSGIRVPTVVELSLPLDTYGTVAVQAVATKEWQPVLVRETRTVETSPFTIASDYGQPYTRLTDNDLDTFEQFALPVEGQGEVTFVVSFPEPVTIAALRLALDDQVALPRTVAVSRVDREEAEVVVAPVPVPQSGVLRFLRTTGKSFLVTFTYAQPLRITELALLEDAPVSSSVRFVRFLAKPGTDYQVLMQPDRTVRIALGEAGDLVSDTGVRRLATSTVTKNPDYIPADSDSDGITDRIDNCVLIHNRGQEDIDGNGRGDACDDYDRDGRTNTEDNCQDEPNRDQRDEDGDGIGDECDEVESRFTEQNAWIPWAGMGFAALVLVGLCALVLRRPVIPNE